MHTLSIHHSGNKEEFILTEDGKTILKLGYNSQVHTARLETKNEKRVFIIENEGLLKPKFIFKNEYGIKMGQMSFDVWSERESIIYIGTNRFRFIIKDQPSPILSAYKESSKKSIFECTISTSENNMGLDNRRKFLFKTTHLYSFILVASWYLFSTISKEIYSPKVTAVFDHP